MGARVVWASCSFSKKKDDEMVTFSQNVHDAIETAVVLYPAPLPSLIDLQDAIDDYYAALVACQGGGTALVELKNVKRGELQEVLRQLTIYVNSLQYGNKVNLLLSGFNLTREPAPIGQLQAPILKKAWSLAAGQMYILVNAFKYQPTYRYEYRVVGDTEWQIFERSRHNVTITGLDRGFWYEFRVAGVNTYGLGVYSAPFIRIVA